MRSRLVLAILFATTHVTIAEPDDPYPDPEPTPAPAPAPITSPSQLPPIHITITNNNADSNTNTNTDTTPVTVSTPVDVSTPVTVSAPSTTSPSRPIVIERTVLVPPPRTRWLAVGLIGSKHDRSGGLRAMIDLKTRRRFTFGLAGTIEATHVHDDLAERDAHDGPRRGSLVAYVALTKRIGRLELRAQVGLGVTKRHAGDEDDAPIARTTDPGELDDDDDDDHRFAPRAEASLLVGLPIGRRLALIAGPVLSAEGNWDDDREHDRERDDERPTVRKSMMAGLRLQF